MMTRGYTYLLIQTLALIIVQIAYGSHGVSMHDNLKYQKNFTKFDYTSEHASKGGEIILHDLSGFDSFNPYLIKGTAPYGMSRLVFDTLGVDSMDEPFSIYGLIAKDIELAEDGLSVTFTLNEKAKFSDGSPITAYDVAFSLEILKSKEVLPFYSVYYGDIKGVNIINKRKIQFLFTQKNRELHLIACQLPVFSKNFYEEQPFEGTSDIPVPPVGSGPYVIDVFELDKSVTYKRNDAYWAKDHPARKGMFNYDKITVKSYMDPTIALEALKGGEFDFMEIQIAKQWARDLVGKRFDSGELKKEKFKHNNNAGIQGFVMNTRKQIFQKKKVRQAISLAFDFQWTNRSLFYNEYKRNNSYFSNSYLAAANLPEGLEKEYLTEIKDIIPEEVFSTPLTPPVYKDKGEVRKGLKKAAALLKQAGWKIENGVLKDADGDKFEFEILLSNRAFERVIAPFVMNLKKLGITVEYRTIDSALFIKRRHEFDYDMIVATFGQSLSPGNEQRGFWHSEVKDVRGSRNYAGIHSESVDFLIEKIIYAKNREQLVAACRALDRVLWYGYYLVPNWYIDSARVVYAEKLRQPQKKPLYFDAFSLLMTWWVGVEADVKAN